MFSQAEMATVNMVMQDNVTARINKSYLVWYHMMWHPCWFWKKKISKKLINIDVISIIEKN